MSAAAVARCGDTTRRRFAVIVLGDLARSPRMKRHAECLAAAGAAVDVLAYVETPLDDWPNDDAIRVHALGASAGEGRRGVIAGVFRLLRDSRDVAAALTVSAPEAVLVQNPPAVHILPIVLSLCRRHRVPLIIDWHNFGWTMLGLRRDRDGAAVRVAGLLERAMARRASDHLCVSEAMRERLAELCGINAVVFRDRPAATFMHVAAADRDRLRRGIMPILDLPATAGEELLDGRAALLVSATSWSADEDFSLLQDALQIWARAGAETNRPKLIVVVSGRGPLRAEYERRFAAAGVPGVVFRTVWLAEGDYARLLAAADLGLCFHRSSSGVDLPMKLADMMGAALPTCVLDYGPCLREVVRDRENAFLFTTAADLATAWRHLLVESPRVLVEMRQRLRAAELPSWQQEWRERTAPLLGCADADE